jgi:hypothetical protein
MNESLKRLSDAELSKRTLVVTSAHALIGTSDDPPPTDVPPEIVFEYELPLSEPIQRCSYCVQKARHRKGFRVRFGDAEYRIGSTCGPSHLNLEFAAAKSGHSGLKRRQQALKRLERNNGKVGLYVEWAERILFGDALRDLERLAGQFRQSAPDAFYKLSRIARGTGSFTETVRVRDLAHEAQRFGNHGGADSKSKETPVFRDEELSLGQLQGVAILIADDLRKVVLGLKSAAAIVHQFAGAPTDDVKTGDLDQVSNDFERSIARANIAATQIVQADRFFDQQNLARIERWASSKTVDSLLVEGASLRISGRSTGKGATLSLPPWIVPPFPDR